VRHRVHRLPPLPVVRDVTMLLAFTTDPLLPICRLSGLQSPAAGPLCLFLPLTSYLHAGHLKPLPHEVCPSICIVPFSFPGTTFPRTSKL